MKKILVIEDDLKLCANICTLLKSEGFKVDFAENGRIGIAKVKEFLPDLIICDIMMPEMNGFEVLDNLSNDLETNSIPFIFLTAKTDSKNFRRGMISGADDYLFKPFLIEELLDAIKARLKKKDVSELNIENQKLFLASKIPHELRTPLVSILGYPDIIVDENNIEEIKKMVGSIKISGGILHRKIEKFILYADLFLKKEFHSYISGPQYTNELNEDNISCFVKKINQDLLPLKRVKINFDKVMLSINLYFIEFIVIELLENGLIFSDIDKNVLLTGYRENGLYKIKVEDFGIGMEKKEIDSISIFNKFGEDQLSAPGFGLGLGIVYRILELCGGSLNIKSEKNKYTVCEVSIPLI